jgi:hypothetical protein
MSKPAALSDADLDALRVTKGWVVRYDQMRSLIAMARERNQFVAAANADKAAVNQAVTYTGF